MILAERRLPVWVDLIVYSGPEAPVGLRRHDCADFTMHAILRLLHHMADRTSSEIRETLGPVSSGSEAA